MESTDNIFDFNRAYMESNVPPAAEEMPAPLTEVIAVSTDENRVEPAPVGQETDNEALSSLLMLSKSNADQVVAKETAREVKTDLIIIFRYVADVFKFHFLFSE